MDIIMKPIGYISSPYKERSEINLSSYGDNRVRAAIQLEAEYLEGISDINPGDEAVVLFYFHKSDGYTLNTFSQKHKKQMGVFSTRCPFRPNGIGMTIVRFTEINENVLTFQGVDMLDGTPVLDIKPYKG